MKSRKKTPLGCGRVSRSCATGLTHIRMMGIGHSQRVPRKEGGRKGVGAHGHR